MRDLLNAVNETENAEVATNDTARDFNERKL